VVLITPSSNRTSGKSTFCNRCSWLLENSDITSIAARTLALFNTLPRIRCAWTARQYGGC